MDVTVRGLGRWNVFFSEEKKESGGRREGERGKRSSVRKEEEKEETRGYRKERQREE